jgi:hypothetical protein
MTHRSRWVPRPISAISVLMLALFSALGAWAQAADPSDIAEGGRLFRQKGNCQACHGWAGDGRKMDSQMPDGANLRESTLNRQDLVMTIKCGRPGTGMPAFDRFAYSDGRCYGLKQADLRASGRGCLILLRRYSCARLKSSSIFCWRRLSSKAPWIAPNASNCGARKSKPAASSLIGEWDNLGMMNQVGDRR